MQPLLALILLALVLFAPSTHPAAAHGYVIRSIPEDRATLERSPARLQYWFSEGLEPEFSSINLRDEQGNVIAEGGVSEEDDSLLVVRLTEPLPDGAYVVELRPAFASDGHVIVETRVFFVGEEVGGVEGQPADDTARPLEVIWKALLFNSTYLLFGTAILYAHVLVPIWGSSKHPRGLLPPRVMRRLTILMWGALLVAAYANVMALLQQTTIFFGVSLDLALEGGLWEVVRIGSRFGDVWNFRMLVLLVVALLLGAAQYFGGQYPKTVRSFWVASTWVLALLLGAQAVNSHAAGSLVMPWVAIAMHWLHAVAVAFWIGGIAALALVLPVALRPYDEEARWEALRPVMRRFSRYAVGALLVVITSGLYSASNWFFSPNDLTTTYGRALGYKLGMIALLLLVAALHHVALRPHLLRWLPFKRLADWARRFGVSLRVETVFAVATISLAALLSATPIPEPEFLQREIETPNAVQEIDATTVQVAITPGGTGVNTLDIVVNRDGEAADGLQAEVQFVAPQLGERSPWEIAEPAENGLYVLASDRIDEIGRWWTLIDLRDATGDFTRAAFEWNISDDATLIQELPPSWFTLLMAFLTTAAVGYVLWPSLQALAARMEWSLLNIAISVSAIVVSTALLIFSVVFIQQQQAAQQAALNPPPQLVNPILPDAESLSVGEPLYNEACAAWEGNEDLGALINQLVFLRDEDLFRATERGWRDLPPCTGDLTDEQRWHLVNYIRTLRE